MTEIRMGILDRPDCLPLLHAWEKGEVRFPARVSNGSQHQIEEMFIRGELDIAPVSPLAYARHFQDWVILPGLLLAANGYSPGTVLCSKVPVNLLQGKTMCVSANATSHLALLKILLDHYYQLKVDIVLDQEISFPKGNFIPGANLDSLLSRADAALVTGDEARHVQSRLPHLQLLDLAAAWHDYTSEPLIDALWVAREEHAYRCPDQLDLLERTLLTSCDQGMQELSPIYRRALLRYFAHAQICGLIPPKVTLHVWRE
ncbi:MAG: menaquinone biosynthetic enzyme MqnA/MqnD family protein [Bacillota bacterium]